MDIKKILFAHDGPIYINDKGQYYGVHYNNELIERYLNLGQSITFIMRVSPVPKNKISLFSLISNSRFSVIRIDNFMTIPSYYKVYNASKIIEKAVIDSDIVILRLPSVTGSIALRYAKKYNKPVLAELVSCVYDALWNYNWVGKLTAHYKYVKYKSIVKNIPYIIYVTSEFLQNRYPSNAHQISCSDVELQVINIEDHTKRKNIILSHDNTLPLLLGTVAALDVAYKGQADVIKAIAILKQNGINVHYHLVGQGDQAYLSKLISKYKLNDSVKIIGPLKHDQVFEFFDKIDIYIQPSKQEGLPRAVIEAMSTACPVLGAKTGGIPELIDSEMIFEPGNINEICSLIKSMTNQVMLEQSYKNFQKSFSYQKIYLDNKRKEFYEQFLSNI